MNRSPVTFLRSWPIVSQGVAAALVAYLVAGAAETGLIRALRPSEREELVLNTQLAIAADLQRRLLPVLPPLDHGVAWAASLEPAGQIGGDFYDLVPLPDGTWMLLVADVSGKGIPAAMALSTLRAVFRNLAKTAAGPGPLLSNLSATLYEQWGAHHM